MEMESDEDGRVSAEPRYTDGADIGGGGMVETAKGLLTELLTAPFYGSYQPNCANSASTLKSPRSGELRMQKLKSHLVRTQSLNVLPL